MNKPGSSVQRQLIFAEYARGEITLDEVTQKVAEVKEEKTQLCWQDRGIDFIGFYVGCFLLALFGSRRRNF